MQKKLNEPSVVITPKDIKNLLIRLELAIPGITRNVIHGRWHQSEIVEIVDNIYYDLKLGVIEAWAQSLFPDKFDGMILAEAGRFDWTNFKVSKANEAVDDIFVTDEIDEIIIAQAKKRFMATAFTALHNGMLAFWTVHNSVTDLLQFGRGRYSTETDVLKWFRNLNDESVKAYGAFIDMSYGSCSGSESVRFVPLDADDPSEEGLVFLGWVFSRSDAEPNMQWSAFGHQFGAIPDFEDATFTESQVEYSTFEKSVGHKWSVTTL